MQTKELTISGISIAQDVIASIVVDAAERVAGVARVGGNDIASNLISVFTDKAVMPEQRVEAQLVNDELQITLRLAVFFGYPFVALAQQVREEVSRAVSEQIGIDCSSVHVCIDSLVFPKE